MTLLNTKKSTDKLLNVIIGTASILLIIHIALIFFEESDPILAVIPMFIPMLYAFGALAAVCIIIMSLGRQRVLNDIVSYWTGIAFLNILITNIFYILSWPGLLASGRPIIGHNTNTAAWIMINENMLLAIIFLAASFISWPGKSALKGNRWTISIAGWTLAIVLLNILMIAFQDYLPLLVINDQFTILSKTTVILLILIMFSAVVLMIHKYRHTKDPITGFISLLMVLVLFTYIEQLMSVNRYALLWYTGRIIGVLSYVVLLYGLLREYINLYSREEEKSRGLIESERKTNEILNAITDSSFMIDKNWIITQINDKALEFFGMKREDIIDKLYWDVFPVTKGTFIENNFRKSVVQNITFSFEMHSMVKEAWIEMHLYPSSNGLTVRFRDISERKLTDEALHESEKKYRELVTNARSIIVKVDNAGKFTFINEYGLNFFGYTEDELFGKTVNETIVPEIESTGRNMNEMLENIYQNPDKHSINVNENIKKNGERVWIEWYNKTIYDSNGIKTGHIAIGVDITRSRKAERELRESEERLKLNEEALRESEQKLWSVLNATQESIYMFDKDGRYTIANSTGLKRLNNISEADLIGHHYSEFMLPELAAQRKEKFDEVFRTGKAVEFGDERNGMFFHHNFFPVFTGDKVTNLVIFSIDITARKKAEDKLMEAKEKLNMALENGKIGVWEWDLKTNDVVWDERMERMYGLDAGTFEGTYPAFESLINEEDIPHFQRALSRSIENNDPFETIYRTKGRKGEMSYINTKAFVNLGKDGKAISMTGVCFDVTAMKKDTEQLLIKLNEELLRSNKELESFAYVASHDLQEPLRMVTSFTQLLQQQYKDKLDYRALEYIQFAVDGSKRMYDLLNGLLTYSRIHSKGKLFNRVELSRVLEYAKKNLEIKINERNAVISSDELPNVFADESQMIQLFQNLIANSIKFSSESPRIHISSKSNTDHYIISIKDNGIGIESQYFDRIFNIFQRLFPKGGEYEGTGIGLSICKRIIERHSGKIWVESEPGNGSTFLFTIPKNNQEFGE